jgi:hypothetical protein
MAKDVTKQEDIEEIDVVGIDWCSTTVMRTFPWDPEQFVEVRRLSKGEKLRRADLATRMTVPANKKDITDIDVSMATTAIRMFEYEHCITDFAIKGPDKKDEKKTVLYRFADAATNRDIYNHLTGKYGRFIDDLIGEVNKDSDEAKTETEEVAGN